MRSALSGLVCLAALFPSGCGPGQAQNRNAPPANSPPANSQPANSQPANSQPAASGPIDIAIRPQILRTGVKRLGINLSGQTFYDSGQMLRTLTFRNPGFEGEIWQSILHCKWVSGNTCTDENQYAVWAAGFLDGASFELISGPRRGATGIVRSSSAVSPPRGVTLTLDAPQGVPTQGDFVILRMERPGNAQAGWWTSLHGGATLGTEFKDLSPHTAGRQALRIEAAGAGQSAAVSSFFDSYAGRSFVQLHGVYTLRFRAKALAGSPSAEVKVERLDTTHGLHTFFSRTVALTSAWQDFSFDFHAAEDGSALGTVGLTFTFRGCSALLDDVALTAAAAPTNPTAFRDEVVQTLRDLHPGVLRYMDNGTDFGSSLDNMLAPPFARRRCGASTQETLKEDIPLGLHEFLTLAKAVGAEPWYAMPPGTSPAEAAGLIEYLAGSPATPYGARRAALGQPAPWTSVFPVIHLELGNEEWNARSFAGSSLADPAVYAQRASAVFAAARAAAAFQPASFDLILGGWATVPWWSGEELKASSTHDSLAVAPYLFTEFNDASSLESVFGPMFAQPEQIDSRAAGYMAQQREAARTAPHPANLAVYEVNLGTMSGSASQAEINQTVPSLGAGLAVADHMLLMLRDLGITTQCLFALPEYVNDFLSTGGGPKKTIPLWGAVVDMGGATDRRRPQFLAEQLANAAILPTLLATQLSAPGTTWNQPPSQNDRIQLAGAHLLQTFAFAGDRQRSLILLNLSRTQPLSVTFSGPQAPAGRVEESRLSSAHITDSNELSTSVATTRRTLQGFDPSRPYVLPPFSMTVLTWRVP